MKEVHLTNASIPGVRCLREMKASTIKRRRDATYASKIIVKKGRRKYADCLPDKFKVSVKKNRREKSRGNRMAIPVRTTEQTRHSIASSLEGKLKNHPAQCIPPNTMPIKDIKKINSAPSLSFLAV